MKPDNRKIVVELGFQKDFSIEVIFAFRTPCDVYGELRPVKNGFGSVMVRIESKLTFEFLDTLQKALDDFKVKLKDYTN